MESPRQCTVPFHKLSPFFMYHCIKDPDLLANIAMLVYNREFAILHNPTPIQTGLLPTKAAGLSPTFATSVAIKGQIEFGIARIGFEPATLLL